MRVSQLLHVMDKDDLITIDDYDVPVDRMTIYTGIVRGIKRDDPVNKMHVLSVHADNDTILVLVSQPRKKDGEQE